MSATVAVTRDNIRHLLGARNPEDYADVGLGTGRLNRIIESNTHLLAGRMDLPRETVQAVALVASTYDYALTGAIASVASVLLNSTGGDLVYQPFTVFNAVYRQGTSVNFLGRPREYTLYETPAQVATIRFGPTPSAADTARVTKSIIPAAFADDAGLIPFAPLGLRALEYHSAAECCALLTRERLAQIGLSPNAYAQFRAQGDAALMEENFRAGALGRNASTVVRLDA